MNMDAKSLREKMKAKAQRLGNMKDSKVDSSDWSPPEPLNADVKTGMKVVGRSAYKSGGSVKDDDDKPDERSDRKPRKIANAIVNRDVKEANDELPGKKHVGGMKDGGRTARKSGGKVGKTNINIVIQPQKAPEIGAPPPGPTAAPILPQPLPQPPGGGGGMPMGGIPLPPPMPPMGGGMPPGIPPIARKAGGRVAKSYEDMTAGAGSGEGREQKTEIARSKHANGGEVNSRSGTTADGKEGNPVINDKKGIGVSVATGPGARASRYATGGRAKSYKDMTAGAGSGEGREQKTEIQRSKHAN